MAKIQKGVSGNPAGRKKGIPNKITTDIKDAITKIWFDNLPSLQGDLDSMSLTSKWMTIGGLLKYGFPTLSSQKNDVSVTNNGKIEFVIKYDNQLPPASDNIIEI